MKLIVSLLASETMFLALLASQTLPQLLAYFVLSLLLLTIMPLCYLHLNGLHKTSRGIGQRKKKQLPPGPKPWPIVGNLPEMFISKPTFRWIHNMMKDMKSDIICIRLGNFYVIPVTCPTISRELFRKQDAVFQSRPMCMAATLLSSGSLTTVVVPFGDQWKKMRRVITKELLSPQKFQWLRGKRIEEADNLVRYVFSHCRNEEASNNGGAVNLRKVARHYSGNVIRKTIFNRRHFGEGTKDGGPGFEEEDQLEALFTILKYVYAFSISDYMPCLKGLDLDGHQKDTKKAVETLDKYHNPIIHERIQQWGGGGRKEMEDWLDVLITLKDENGKPLLTPEEFIAQIRELSAAAVDNPSNALEWALAEMLNQPELFEKATEELDKVVGKDRLVQESDFPKLFYVKALAREAFRKHPIVPFNLPHVALSDTTVGGYYIPKGSHVYLSRMGLGRNPDAWDEPDKFKPERHLKDDGSDILLSDSDFRILSFGAGRRGCPAVNFGSAMTVMLFARLLHAFDWSLPPGQSSVDLNESEEDIFLAKPLIAVAKPRLAADAYLWSVKS